MAEDVVQETFHRIWMRADRIRYGVRSLEPWIFTIARNRSLDYLRSPHGPERHRTLDAVPLERLLIDADPENRLAMRDEERRIKRAFARLSARHRQVLGMAFYGDLSQSQIAEILRLPLGTVKTWTRNGLRELRRKSGSAAQARR